MKSCEPAPQQPSPRPLSYMTIAGLVTLVTAVFLGGAGWKDHEHRIELTEKTLIENSNLILQVAVLRADLDAFTLDRMTMPFRMTKMETQVDGVHSALERMNMKLERIEDMLRKRSHFGLPGSNDD